MKVRNTGEAKASDQQSVVAASLGKRVCAMTADIGMLVGYWVVISLAGHMFLPSLDARGLLTSDQQLHLMDTLLFVVPAVFYIGTLVLRRQSFGMKSHSLEIRSCSGSKPSWTRVLARVFLMPLSIGVFFWLPSIRRDRRMLHDIVSRTETIHLCK